MRDWWANEQFFGIAHAPSDYHMNPGYVEISAWWNELFTLLGEIYPKQATTREAHYMQLTWKKSLVSPRHSLHRREPEGPWLLQQTSASTG